MKKLNSNLMFLCPRLLWKLSDKIVLLLVHKFHNQLSVPFTFTLFEQAFFS